MNNQILGCHEDLYSFIMMTIIYSGLGMLLGAEDLSSMSEALQSPAPQGKKLFEVGAI